MADRVLTEKEVESLSSLNETMLNGLPKADDCELIASHRTLHLRHRQLVRQVRELEKAQAMALQIVEATEKLKTVNECDD